MEIVGTLIDKDEEERHPMVKASGIEALKYLMKDNGLKQPDLGDIGLQDVVYEIPNSKRESNVWQISSQFRWKYLSEDLNN